MFKRLLLASIFLTACINSNASHLETDPKELIGKQMICYNKPTEEYVFYELHSTKNRQFEWVLMNRMLTLPRNYTVTGKKLFIWNEQIKAFVPFYN